MNVPNDYKLLFQFIDTYLPVGFEGIDREDPLMRKVCALMIKNNQYFYIADMVEMKILYTCSAIKQILGVEASEYNPGFQFDITHPDDKQRHSVARSKMIKLSNDLLINSGDYTVLSTNLRFQHAQGHYINFIVQAYAFVSNQPRKSTYCLFVKTDIDWFGPIKHGYHFYVGKDMSYFRKPDKELILTGNVFTDREFEILDLLRQGYDSKTIGEKLFVSSHTVDTHRRNIIKKTDYHNTAELIIDLQERGFF